jgi:hypothetical protein
VISLKADIAKILAEGEHRPDAFSVHRLKFQVPEAKPPFEAVISAVPVNYQKGDCFEACDLQILPIGQLEAEPFEFEYGCEKNNFIARYNDSTDIENSTLASFEIIDSNGVVHWINYKLFSANPSGNQIDSNKIKYLDVMPDIDLEYITDTVRLKENIIIKAAKDSYSYTFTLKLDEKTYYELQADGSILFKDTTTSEVVYSITKPFAKDANGVNTENVHYIFGTQEYGGIVYPSISVVLEDADFLASAVFPITIDPSTTIYPTYPCAARIFGQSWDGAYPPPLDTETPWSDGYQYFVGRKAYSSGFSRHWVEVGLLRINTSSLPDSCTVLSAQLGLNCYDRDNGDTRYFMCDWWTGAWSTAAYLLSAGEVTGNAFSIRLGSINMNGENLFTLNSPSYISKIGNTMFRACINGAGAPDDPSYGAEWRASQYDGDQPIRLIVTYTNPPTPPGAITSPTAGQVVNQSVTIQWGAATDPDGDVVHYDLAYSPNGGTNWYPITTGVIGTSYAWNTSAITAGTNYKVAITSYDSNNVVGGTVQSATFIIRHISGEVDIGGAWKQITAREVCIEEGGQPVWKQTTNREIFKDDAWKEAQ